MIEEIINKYGQFSDSWIENIHESENSLLLRIVCANKENQFKYEMIELIFFEIKSFVKKEDLPSKKIAIKDALLYLNNDEVIFDIDPIDHFDFLKENQNSQFKIKCKKIKHRFVEFYKETNTR